MPKFLTFDLGTTLFKIALFDHTGHLLGVERIAPPIEHPRPGWAIIHPEQFERTLIKAATQLRTHTGGDFSDVAAVSFATQANSFTFLNSAGKASMPLILWTDQRAADLAPELAEIASIPGYRNITGMPKFSPSLALAKILWIKRHHPQLLNGAKQLCFISDLLTNFLTDAPATEAGVAGLSGALDIRSLQWRPDVLDRLSIPPLEMPLVCQAGSDLGPINKDKARMLGLPSTCRFIVGCLDQYSGAIGTGTIAPNQLCETTGTVLAAVRCSTTIDPTLPPDVFHGPAFDPGLYFQMSFSSTSANLLEYYRNKLPPPPPDFSKLSDLAHVATNPPIIEEYKDPDGLESSFRNVRDTHTPGQVARGIMLRVAQSLKSQVQSLCANHLPTEIRSAGGAARSDTWLQIKANTLAIPFLSLQCEEPTSLGAALLAARAIGLGDLPSLSKSWITPRKRFDPS